MSKINLQRGKLTVENRKSREKKRICSEVSVNSPGNPWSHGILPSVYWAVLVDYVPTCRRSTIGGRAFPVAAAKVWNGLPSDVTSASSLSVFKNRPKTYLFRRCYETV